MLLYIIYNNRDSSVQSSIEIAQLHILSDYSRMCGHIHSYVLNEKISPFSVICVDDRLWRSRRLLHKSNENTISVERDKHYDNEVTRINELVKR